MSSQPLPRCRQHARTVVPLDCARCAVRDLAVCSSLPSPEADALERLVSSIELQPNGELARAGQPCRHAYSVTAGMLRVVRTLADARRQVHRAAIEAVAAGRACAFGSEGSGELRRRCPSFERTVLARACRDLDDAHDSMLLLARLSPLERLASFLVRLRQQLRIRADDPCVALPMGRGDIADHLGLTVETVSRSFTRLREQGVIALPVPHRAESLDHAAPEGLASALH